MPDHSRWTVVPGSRGFTLVEILLVVSILVVLFAMALPVTSEAIDALRTQGAARYLAARIVHGRMQAITRSTIVGLRFVGAGNGDYSYRPYIDGNRNGIRTADITRGTDLPLAAAERVGDNFGGVVFGLMPGVPDADGLQNTGTDGVRIGSARILTTSPDGTATAGTLYIHGKHAQYAIRVLGPTGRVRVMQFQQGDRKWTNR
jgi:prepilin-type N-terminal cleavage/methylation domain-containing protein